MISVVRVLVIFLSLAVLVVSSEACVGHERTIVRGRPTDAEVIYDFRLGAGQLGGGGTGRIYLSTASFDVVADGYRAVVKRLGGGEMPIGRNGLRFDAGDDCLRILPWNPAADSDNFRGALTAEQLSKLAHANAFIEELPDDCAYDG